MKTYHQYQSESKQAEQKLSVIQQQMAKIKSVKKQKSMEKRVEKVDCRHRFTRTIPSPTETEEVHRNESQSVQSAQRLSHDDRIGQYRAAEILLERRARSDRLYELRFSYVGVEVHSNVSVRSGEHQARSTGVRCGRAARRHFCLFFTRLERSTR